MFSRLIRRIMFTASRTKQGSYVVEATIAVPIFVIAVIMLISIIPSMQKAENYCYAVCDEMRLEAVKSAFRQNGEVLPAITLARIINENGYDDTKITYYRYGYSKNNIDDLITMRVSARFEGPDPFNLFGAINYTGKVTGRAFSGTYMKHPPNLTSDDKYVFVFPEKGKRYHNKACSYVVAACEICYLTQDIKQRYAPCKICNADSAQIGTAVFVFEKSGKAYHTKNCSSVDRYCIEIKKSEAVDQGYTPCSKCGGE